MLPTRQQAKELLHSYVTDTYQRHHAQMVATAMAGYAEKYSEDADLWYITGLLHDIDFEKHPDTHPAESLGWFADWDYPTELIHAVEAHAYGYNGFETLPETKLAASLIACDEICGIFYAYQKVNPVPYGEMKVKSIGKRLKEKGFAPKIKREDIEMGCQSLGVDLGEHVENLISFLGKMDG